MPRAEVRTVRGVGRRELQTYIAGGLVAIADAGPTEADLRRVRRIRRLHRDLGLSYEAIEVVLRLVDRLEAAEHAEADAPRPTVRVTVIGR
ncbi:MAG TPA: chaperone modulator CbpM [Candidatus Dormibacteraeota bacterium]|nr:chaperone modulator CbpM [Candidatus Dormibacteraeota bacterium]